MRDGDPGGQPLTFLSTIVDGLACRLFFVKHQYNSLVSLLPFVRLVSHT